MDSILLFAVVLSIAGGGIAFIGDRLGTWVGKKRLSKFGLRPKHTAMLYTTITGGIIAILTLGLLLTVDRDVQYAITRGMAEIHGLRKVIQQDNQKIVQSRRDKDQAQSEATEARAEAADAKQDAAKAKKSEAQAEAQSVKAHVKAVEEQAELSVDQKKLAAEEARLASAQTDLASAKAQVLAEADQVSKERGLNQQAVAKLVKDSRRLVELEDSVTNREHKVAQLDTRVASLENQSKTLEKRTLDLESHVDIYQAGDQIDRLVVEASLPPAEIRTKLQSWLDTLSLDASVRGAGAGDNGRDIVVQGDGSETASESIPEDASLDTLADHISQQRKIVDSVIVQAEARFNTERGGQVPIDLQSFDNILVFPKDGAVATTVIDGTLPQHDVMQKLTAFLSDDLKAAARDHSVMPYVDPQTLKVRYGAIDGHLLDIVGQIQSAGPNARVTAVASDNVYTEGPLKVRLQVDPAPTAGDASDTGVTTAGTTERSSTPSPMAHL